MYSYPDQVYPRRYVSIGHADSLVKHIGVGPGQQGHLPLCITSNATFGGEDKLYGKSK